MKDTFTVGDVTVTKRYESRHWNEDNALGPGRGKRHDYTVEVYDVGTPLTTTKTISWGRRDFRIRRAIKRKQRQHDKLPTPPTTRSAPAIEEGGA